jgi:hypothetical protein
MTRIVNDVLISAIQVPILFNLVSGSEDEVEHLLALIEALRWEEAGINHHSVFMVWWDCLHLNTVYENMSVSTDWLLSSICGDPRKGRTGGTSHNS